MLLNFQGSDAYRIRQAITEIIGQQDQEGLSVAHFDLAQSGQDEEFERELKYPSFFQSARVIILHNALANAQTAEQTQSILGRYDIEEDPAIIVIAISSSTSHPSVATKKLISYLEHHGLSRSFEPLSGAERSRWISEFCGQRGSLIQPTAISALAERVTLDSWALAMELEKLCAYVDGQAITREIVEELVPISDERSEFELTDAFYAHDKRGMVAALWRRLSGGTSEQMILGILSSGVRSMLITRAMSNQGLDITTIARIANLHPFVVQKALRGANTYDEQRLRTMHGYLAELDRRAKDGDINMADGLMESILDL